MQTHVSPRLGMAHESLCCRSEATAHLARFTCVLRPRQKIASKFDGLVHLLRVLRGAVWIYGTSASCGQSFLVSTTYGCKCLFIEAGVDGASVHIERWLPERATQLHNKVNNYGEQKTILNGCAAHSELVLPAVWRKCMRGTFACDRVCACHKKTSISLNGRSNTGRNVFARILSNAMYILVGYVAVMDGFSKGSEVSLSGFICITFLRFPVFVHLVHSNSHFPMSSSSRAIFLGAHNNTTSAQIIVSLKKLLSFWVKQIAVKRLILNISGLAVGLEADEVGKVVGPARMTHVVDFQPCRGKLFERSASEALSSQTLRRKVMDHFTDTSQHLSSSIWNTTQRGIFGQEPRHGIFISGSCDIHQHRHRTSQMLTWIFFMAAVVNNHLSVQRTFSSDLMQMRLVPIIMDLCRDQQSSELNLLSFINKEFICLVPWHVSLRDVSCTMPSGHNCPPGNLTETLSGVVVALLSRRAPFETRVGVGVIKAYSASQESLHIITPLSTSVLEMVDTIVLSSMRACFHNHHANIDVLREQCFYGLTTEGTGARAIRSRNNIVRGGKTHLS